MAPKSKKAVAPKDAPAAETKKSSKGSKRKAGGEENGTERPQGRTSKRNIDKVVVYKEVAENVDEKASENQPRKGAGAAKSKSKRKAKRAKRTRGTDSEESDSSDEENSDDEDFSPGATARVKSSSDKPPAAKAKPSSDKPLAAKPSPDKSSPDKSPVAKAKSSPDKPPAAKKAKIESEGSPNKTEAVPNKTETDYEGIEFASDKKTPDGKPWNLKISSWNISGMRAWLKKGALDFIKHENPDIMCIQDVRCPESKLPPEAYFDGYHVYWLPGEKDGYAGMGLYSKEKPIQVRFGLGIKEHDIEGRIITAEYETFFLVSTYVPNAGRGLVTLPKRLKWDPDLRSYLKYLEEIKPVILCGDLNVAHEAIDLTNPKTNTKNAGFTQEERDGMSELLKSGFIDTYRLFYPDKTGAYTFWTYMNNARSKNIGWRLDYFIVSEKFVPNVCDNIIRSEVYGSDHCPITLLVNV